MLIRKVSRIISITLSLCILFGVTATSADSANIAVSLTEYVNNEVLVMYKDGSIDVELITPIAIEAGLRFAIREGGRTVGSGVVTAINE